MAFVVTEFSSGITAGAFPEAICLGSDGNLWFTESGNDKIGRITPAGTVTEFNLVTGFTPRAICAGPDGNLWFTSPTLCDLFGDFNNYYGIGKITTSGTITYYDSTAAAAISGIVAGSDGNLWFTVEGTGAGRNKIGRITTSGVVTLFSITTSNSGPRSICAGPDGNLWFTERTASKVAKCTTGGTITEYAAGSSPDGICSDGTDLWITSVASAPSEGITRVTTAGVVTEFPFATQGVLQQVVLGPDGNLWATCQAHEIIYRMSPAGMLAAFVIVFISGNEPTPTGICVGPNSDVWYAGYDTGIVGKVDSPYSYNPPKKGKARNIVIALDQMGQRGTKQIDPTISPGDFKVDTDGGGFSNIAYTPLAIPFGTCAVLVRLNATEMNGDVITIKGVTQTNPKQWADFQQCILTTA